MNFTDVYNKLKGFNLSLKQKKQVFDIVNSNNDNTNNIKLVILKVDSVNNIININGIDYESESSSPRPGDYEFIIHNTDLYNKLSEIIINNTILCKMPVVTFGDSINYIDNFAKDTAVMNTDTIPYVEINGNTNYIKIYKN